jgi:hypothetical protein
MADISLGKRTTSTLTRRYIISRRITNNDLKVHLFLSPASQ